MFSIHLKDLRFFSFHGIHDEERILGNDYQVDIAITLDSTGDIITLDQTVNYAVVYELARATMAVPTALLETVAQDLAQKIYTNFPHASSASISIFKKNPPMANIQGSVGVSYTKKF